jgi:lipid-binding SYLF domain-containing protein
MRRIVFIAAAMVLAQLIAFRAPVLASEATEAREIVDKAGTTFNSFMADKNYTWFHENVKKAKGLLIFPRVIRAGFFWGGSGGNGVFVARDEGTGEWSQPVFYTVGTVSFGLQIGAEEAEVVMLAMSRKAIDSLYASSFKFGGDIAVAAGPRGVGAEKVLTSDFISFAKAKGLYAGLNFEGSGIQVRDDLNKAYYGSNVRPLDVVVKKEVSNPASAVLLEALRKAGSPR